MGMLEKYTFSNKDNTDLNVYRCGFEECSPGYGWGPAVRDHFNMHYILSGKGTFYIQGERYSLKANEGFLIWPDTVVRYEADEKDPWTYAWVGFHGLKAEFFLKKAGLSLNKPTFVYSADDRLINCLNAMRSAVKPDSASELMVTGYLYHFLSLLIKNHRQTHPVEIHAAGGDRHVSRAIEYITKNYASSLSIGELAQQLNIDRSYLFTLFRTHTGLSPRDFIIRFRMDKAGDLLKNPLLSIGDVARSVGYDDPLQFSKTFKKVKGVSPSQGRIKLPPL